MNKMFLMLLICTVHRVYSIPLVRSAPEECPLKDGNLLSVKLFVSGDNPCYDLCEADKKCNFYKFYGTLDGRPPQCFLFETCGKNVVEANPECYLSKENCMGVRPFVASKNKCRELCQLTAKCGYYKYVEPEAEEEERSNAQGRSTRISIATLSDAGTPEFCYLLKSCSKRMIDNILCPLGVNNFLDVKFFVKDQETCMMHCDNTEGCRYYYWHPIDHSEAPLYCYLFRQCADKDDEPEVALVMGGRHPGHYFMTSQQSNDVVTRTDVCPMSVNPVEAQVKRTGAVAKFINDVVLLCGGRNRQEAYMDCIQQDLQTNRWSNHTTLLRPRDESSIAMVGPLVFLVGGVGEASVETLDSSQPEAVWTQGPALPRPRSRTCAVSTGGTVIVTGGHENGTDSGSQSLPHVLKLDVKEGKWISMPDMMEARRDHGCLYVELEHAKGILVTGGLGLNNQVLGSVEFYDMEEGSWKMVSSLKVARMEHGMSLVYGIPTVIGGLSGEEFLSSMEQFDKSSTSWNVPLQRDWRIINQVLSNPRYEHAVASIPASKIVGCSDAVVIDNEV